MDRVYVKSLNEVKEAFNSKKATIGGCLIDGIEYEFSCNEKMFNSSMGGYSCYAKVLGMTGYGSISRIENVIYSAEKYWYRKSQEK